MAAPIITWIHSEPQGGAIYFVLKWHLHLILFCILLTWHFYLVLHFVLFSCICFNIFLLFVLLNDIYIFRDSAPHHSEAPARYLNKMTSILKEKVKIPQLWSWLSWSCWLLWSRLSSCWCSRINDQGHGHCSWEYSPPPLSPTVGQDVVELIC